MRGETNKMEVINKRHYDRGSHIVISTSAATLANQMPQETDTYTHHIIVCQESLQMKLFNLLCDIRIFYMYICSWCF